uniref:E3 ubiquitin-protein ligase RNF135-like n=1 Tax=Oncorhynchus gorbuscha TaxID=8017 RepID=UPI001EAF1990|nr:E3 ubiquitin-protein ligase RNF135-like [Oncorhynchus gorbuscha]
MNRTPSMFRQGGHKSGFSEITHDPTQTGSVNTSNITAAHVIALLFDSSAFTTRDSRIVETMDSISCSICLDLLKDPVTISCGHSYCKGCIKEYWSLDDQKGIHSCPQCRQTFTPRPALNRNILLAQLVEKLKNNFKTVPSASCFPGPEDVKYDHDDSAAAAEMTEKQGQLREKRQQVGLRICEREGDAGHKTGGDVPFTFSTGSSGAL